ncbi:hypothetical protein C2845_PM01G10490 [Panicum miliaceum]|uniref:Uncharacterized protein n=1 Tax=Panicum miliaceum TaxID=4540 RepID=A0A3L6TPY0_PANMI|nr:hypothetical protein C2845_PM01G10490 [Panicum miliaceum]
MQEECKRVSYLFCITVGTWLSGVLQLGMWLSGVLQTGSAKSSHLLTLSPFAVVLKNGSLH